MADPDALFIASHGPLPGASPAALAAAREMLRTPDPEASMLPLVGAAGLAAAAALALAAVVILGPPAATTATEQTDVNPWSR